MLKRQPYDLKIPLGLWNVLLAGFSMVGAFNTVTAFFLVQQTKGLEYEMCSAKAELTSPWVFLFCVSKIPELIDTLFIVLRKRELRFLHWYHHVATMWFCWLAWSVLMENGGLFASMNLLVHSVMYSYFALSAFGFRFPDPLRMGITSLQITQMIFGTLIILHNIIKCNTHPELSTFGLLMYISYAVLFIDLFLKSYVFKEKKSEHQHHANGEKHNNGNKPKEH